MKKLFFYAAVVLAAVSFSACSDDDEEPNLPFTPGSIAGTWQLIHEKTWENYDGEIETWSENFPDESGWYLTYTFDENGSFTEIDYTNYEASGRENRSYSISDNVLRIDGYCPYNIKKLTESRLVLVDRHIDDIENCTFEDIMTFKRIE